MIRYNNLFMYLRTYVLSIKQLEIALITVSPVQSIIRRILYYDTENAKEKNRI